MKIRFEEILLVFSVAFLVSISPVIARWSLGIPGIIGFPTYYHQRISDYIISGTFNWQDPLSFGGRPYTYPPFFSFMLAGFGLALGLELGGVIMMGLLGGLTAVVSLLIARELIVDRRRPLTPSKRIAFLVIILSSPAFIFLFSHLSTRSPPILLGLLGIYLAMKKRPWWQISLPLAGSLLFHPETGLIFSFLLFMVDKKHLGHLKSFLMAILIAGLFYVPFFISYGLPQQNAIHTDYIERAYGLESLNVLTFSWETSNTLPVGPNYDGIALLVLLFSFAGLFLTKNRLLRIWFLTSLALALASTRLLLYLVFPASILATIAFYYVSGRLKYRKAVLTAFLIYAVSMGAWSCIAFGTSYPLPKQTNALLWIRQNTPDNATILSEWPDGHWITGIAYKKSFVDGYAEYAPEADKRMAELEAFYRNCTVPQGYGIEYAYFEDWILRKENVTCIDRFEKVYDRDWVYVYSVSPG